MSKKFVKKSKVHEGVKVSEVPEVGDKKDLWSSKVEERRVNARPTIWNLKKIQIAKQKFRLISGLAELTRETKITAEMRLVANIFSWNTA